MELRWWKAGVAGLGADSKSSVILTYEDRA